MATKTIKLKTVTLHVRDEKKSTPVKFNEGGLQVSGKHVVIEHPPGTAVTLDADEADRILAEHEGEEVVDEAKEPKK